MRSKITYPITVSQVRKYRTEVTNYFVNKRHRKCAFLGVSILDGSFFHESRAELMTSLELGEILSLARLNESKINASQLTVSRADGTCIGLLPYTDSIFPCKLLDLGIKVWCRFEAAEIENEILTIAVSIFCEDY